MMSDPLLNPSSIPSTSSWTASQCFNNTPTLPAGIIGGDSYPELVFDLATFAGTMSFIFYDGYNGAGSILGTGSVTCTWTGTSPIHFNQFYRSEAAPSSSTVVVPPGTRSLNFRIDITNWSGDSVVSGPPGTPFEPNLLGFAWSGSLDSIPPGSTDNSASALTNGFLHYVCRWTDISTTHNPLVASQDASALIFFSFAIDIRDFGGIPGRLCLTSGGSAFPPSVVPSSPIFVLDLISLALNYFFADGQLSPSQVCSNPGPFLIPSVSGSNPTPDPTSAF